MKHKLIESLAVPVLVQCAAEKLFLVETHMKALER